MTPPAEPGLRRVTVDPKITGDRHMERELHVSTGCAARLEHAHGCAEARTRPDTDTSRRDALAPQGQECALPPEHAPRSPRRERANARGEVRSRCLPVRGALLPYDSEAGRPTCRSGRRILHPLGKGPSVSSFRERAAAVLDRRWLSTTALDARCNVPRNLLRNVSLASRCAASFAFQSSARNRTHQAKNTLDRHFLFHSL